MFGPVRSLRWLTLAAVLPVVGCGAPPVDGGEDGEGLGTAELAATSDKLDGRLYKKRSSAPKYRGTKADWIVCTNTPVNMGATFTNRGEATWRDVAGKGKTVGSDVKLVTRSGNKDTMVGMRFLSLADNVNDNVRGQGSDADFCSSKPGCRRTYFNAHHLWTISPPEPGFYGGQWRLRDYSAAHDTTSVPVSGFMRMRFRVVDCLHDCGCTVVCTDGAKREVPAGDAATCKDNASAACEPANVLSHEYVDCSTGGTGGTGGGTGGTSGSGGGWGTGGTGAGGSGTGGGWGSGGSGSGGAAGSSGGFSCGGAVCEMPEPLVGQAEFCCTADNACGVKGVGSSGQCIATAVPDPDDPNDPGAYGADDETWDPENNKDTPDEAGFIDPQDAIASDEEGAGSSSGHHATSEGGCSMASGSRNDLAGLGLLALLGLAWKRRRR